MSARARNCVLMFDEMSIKKCFDWHDSKQLVEGFVDLGHLGRQNLVGTHVLVFMARGLIDNWKQPLAFFVVNNSAGKTNVNIFLDKVLEASFGAGLNVRAVVSDQGSGFQSVCHSKQVTVENPHFKHGNRKVFFIFDFPHLIKSVRNNLIEKSLWFNGSEVSWNDIRELYNLEKDKGTRAALKLSSKHIHPNSFEKMNCRLAMQIFSNSVSSAIRTAVQIGELKSETAPNTATFLKTMNDLLDNLNSRTLHDANPNRRSLSIFNSHVEDRLENMLAEIKEWFFIDHTDRSLKTVPCLLGLQQTVSAVLQLWDDLREEKVADFLLTSRLNSDPIENFFSVIRMHGGTYNNNPPVKSFRQAFRKNIVVNLNRASEYANCQPDDVPMLLHEMQIDHNEEQDSNEQQAAHLNLDASDVADAAVIAREAFFADDDLGASPQEIQTVLQKLATATCKLETCAVVYFAGYVARRSTDRSKCEKCRTCFISQNTELVLDNQTLIAFKAYTGDEKMQFGSLVCPSEEFSEVLSILNAIFDKCYPPMRSEIKLLDKLFHRVVQAVNRSAYAGWFDDKECASHRRDMEYFAMTVKIHKDTKWFGQLLRSGTARTAEFFGEKPHSKLRKLRGK